MMFVNINKNLVDKDNSIILELKGVCQDNYNVQEKEELVDRLLNLFSKSDLIYLIKALKTVFIDVEKAILKLDLKRDDSRFLITFDDWNLTYYRNTLKKSKNDYYIVNYTRDNGICGKASNYDCLLESKDEVLSFKDFLDTGVTSLIDIKNVIYFQPDISSRMLNTIYQLFYRETPDFSLVDDRKKATLMLSLLEKYGISLGDEFYFQKLSKSSYPVSLNLTKIMNELAPLGKLSKLECVQFTSEAEKTIRVVGNEVMNYIKKFDCPIEVFEKLVMVNYSVERCFSSNLTPMEMASKLQVSVDETENNLKLLKKLDAIYLHE